MPQPQSTFTIFGRLDISNDQQLVNGSSDRTLKPWTTTGQLKHTLTGHDAKVNAIAHQDCRRSLVSGGDDFAIMVWDLEAVLGLDEWADGCEWLEDYLRRSVASQQAVHGQIQEFCKARNGENLGINSS